MGNSTPVDPLSPRQLGKEEKGSYLEQGPGGQDLQATPRPALAHVLEPEATVVVIKWEEVATTMANVCGEVGPLQNAFPHMTPLAAVAVERVFP